MSNTSLKKIQVPALNHANFGKAIMEQFANIDANFQKLANFELGAGVPGKSCLYVTINLMTPFVYPTSDIIKRSNNYDVNLWMMWAKQIETTIKPALGEKNWNDIVVAVDKDYEQFARLTNCDKYTYANIAAKMLWGSPATFVSSYPDPTPESLTGALHAKYKDVEGELTCKDANGNDKVYYGNWLWKIFKTPIKDFGDTVRAHIFIDHMLVSKPGRIIVAISPSESGLEYYPVGSLEYWYIDPRYRNGATDREDTGYADISCVMHWTPEGSDGTDEWKGHFEILEIFPTIRRGEDGVYYWFINGMNTGVPVQGPAGKDGSNAQLIVVQRVENVVGYHPEKYPNGRIAIAPFGGENITVPLSAFAGDSLRNLPSRTQYTMDMPTMIPQLKTGNWPENIIKDEVNAYNRLTSVKIDMSRADYADYAWLDKKIYEGYTLSEPYNLFRIYRLVGRELLWKSTRESKYDTATKDPLNHYHDPSCDEYYFNKEGCGQISVPDDSSSTQQLIDLLDGAAAIVLPGPAYQFDRTDSTYWFTTLRKVEWRKPESQPGEHSGIYMLMAYCSDEERFHNAVDEHTQAGMMQRLDVFAYKSNGDNRNKPRGLMLPIGSAFASYTDGAFEDAWAAHIIHSDCGGFTSFERDANDDRRGHQFADPDNNMVDTFAIDAWTEATGRAKELREMQYREVIGKKVLHVGSVMDYRALNYVSNDANDPNGGVPGRVKLNTEQNGMIGSADFYGERDVRGWFEGSELHVDEPVTITRYRDLHKRQRLLNVEGDVVIGPRKHKNGPKNIYRNRDGGLVVHSTVSPDTGKDDSIFPDEYDIVMSIFNKDWFLGLELTHRNFQRDIKDDGDQSWRSTFNHYHTGERMRSIYDVDGSTISTDAGHVQSNKHRFSILADDGIGARVLIVQDGIVVYNPQGITDDGRVRSAFSVDSMGNIQTMGEEIRSNADDALWVFHSRWVVPDGSKYADIYTNWADATERDWIKTDSLNTPFTAPGHNDLMIGCDHEFQHIPSAVDNKPWHLARYWRASNWHDWELERINGADHNTELCMIPAGWMIGFGSQDKNGYHARTFSPDTTNGKVFGRTWGANEYLPTVGIFSFDNNHFYGTIEVDGPNDMAVRSAALGTGYEKTYSTGRYNVQSKYGLIVGPARGVINRRVNEILDADDFLGDPLTMSYRSIALRENVADEKSSKYGLGDKPRPDNMFINTIDTPIAIWSRGSIFTSDSLIADNDLVVNRLATIRGQIRAKSFRRHNCSQDGQYFCNNSDHSHVMPSEWAFLLDDGYSSVNAYCASNADEFLLRRPTESDSSPLYIDYGDLFGNKRLAKFGWSKDVQVTESGEIVYRYPNDSYDRNICLIASQPFKNESKVYTGTLFNKPGILPFTARFSCVMGVCILDIDLYVNLPHFSRDNNKKGWFGRQRRALSYGISDKGSLTSPDKDWGQWDKHFREDGNKGQHTRCVTDANSYTDDKIAEANKICSGFSGFFSDLQDYLPKNNLHVFVGSLYKNWGNCNWNAKGADSDRSFQKGCWFRLGTDGVLSIPYWNDCGALFPTKMHTNVTFVWNVMEDARRVWYQYAYSTNLTDNPTPIMSGGEIEIRSTPPADYPNSTYKYLYARSISSISKPAGVDFDAKKWQLIDTYSETNVRYLRSSGISIDESSGKQLPTGNIDYNIDANIAENNPTDLITGIYKYVWSETTIIVGTESSTIYDLLAAPDDTVEGGDEDEVDNIWATDVNDSTVIEWINKNLSGYITKTDTITPATRNVTGQYHSTFINISGNEATIFVDIWANNIHQKTDTVIPTTSTTIGKFQFSCQFSLPQQGQKVTSINNLSVCGFDRIIPA